MIKTESRKETLTKAYYKAIKQNRYEKAGLIMENMEKEEIELDPIEDDNNKYFFKESELTDFLYEIIQDMFYQYVYDSDMKLKDLRSMYLTFPSTFELIRKYKVENRKVVYEN